MRYVLSAIGSSLFSALLNQFRHETSPTRLMTRSNTGAVVAMEVFVEGHEVAPVRIVLKLLHAAEDRSPAAGIP
jgi:hypothetical protein